MFHKRIIADQPNPQLQKILGFLPDDFPLYDDLTVVDYLDYFARLYYLREPNLAQRISEVLELVNLENKRTSLISTLSRGMKQRLSLARTIIYRHHLSNTCRIKRNLRHTLAIQLAEWKRPCRSDRKAQILHKTNP